MTQLPVVLMSDDEVAAYGRLPDAGFGALQTASGLLPMTALEVDAQVAGVIAATEIAQTFVNSTGGPIEATYVFPLPDRAAVHRFRMEVAGRVVDGVVEERGAARAQYDEAIAHGHRAAITEEERAGVFTLRVGNLLPGEAATVRLSLVGPLPVDDGEVTFRFPLVVAPRYMPGTALGGPPAGLGEKADTSLVPDASRLSPPVLLDGMAAPVRLRLRVRVSIADHRAHQFASSLHAIVVSHEDAHVIEIKPGEKLDRDFILRWHADAAALQTSLTCVDDADGTAGTFLLTLVPPSTTAVAARPRDVVFVLDRSGSMQGWKMVAARRAAARMIDSLTSRDRFCAIAFDNTSELLPEDRLVDGTDRHRFRAVEKLAVIEARGGTELAEPLRRAVGMLAGGTTDRERVIVLVTDGQVGNEDHILRELAPTLRNIKMFTLGIDQAVNAAFLRRLASAGGGLCELVESEDRLDDVMAKVHRRIGAPIATELALVASGLEIDAESVSPSKLPDVYAGAPVSILGRYRGPAPTTASLRLVGTTLGEALDERISRRTEARAVPARATEGTLGTWLAASWARANIRDLEDRYAIGARHLEAQIVQVSKRFGVLSRFTAFLAVDRSEIANERGALTQVVQPVLLPAGWAMPAAAPAPGGPSLGRARFAASSEMARRAAPVAQAVPALFSPSDAPFVGRAVPSAPISLAPPPPPRSPSAPRPPVAPAPVDVDPDGGRAYLVTLAALARALEAAARTPNATAIRMLRQRLTQWVEDVRAAGDLEALADAVEQIVQRMPRAADVVAADIIALGIELAALASGPPTATSPSTPRPAFWK